MIVCDLCGDEDIVWQDSNFALCLDHCQEALAKNMASPEQERSIKAALKDIGELVA